MWGWKKMRYVLETVESIIDDSVTLVHYELYDTLISEVLLVSDGNYDELKKVCSVLNDHYELILLLKDNNLKLKKKVEELGGKWYDI